MRRLCHFRRACRSHRLSLGCRYAVAYVDIAGGFELEVVAACVIGGISIAGGIGSVGGALLGALFLGIVKNALPVINISPFWQLAISGSAIIIAVAFNATSNRTKGRVILKKRSTQHEPRHPRNRRAGRQIPDRLKSPLQRFLVSWELLLLVVAVAVFTLNSFASPYFLDPWNLSDATFNFTEKAMIAFAMGLLIISGEIDLSVASIIALSSTAMGFAVQMGADTPVLVMIGLGTGLLCGAFNGFLVTGFGLPSIVVTIGTMSLFRGISYIVLGDKAYTGYPSDFAFFGQGYVWWVISFEFVLFALLAIVFAVILHKTNFGRAVYVVGNNPVGALFPVFACRGSNSHFSCSRALCRVLPPYA